MPKVHKKRKCVAAKKQIKSHLLNKGNSNIEVSESLISYWFHIFNSAAFKNKLPVPDKFVIRPMNGAWGYCEGRSRTKNCIITISSKINNKSFLLATIAHEMVHQYQWIYGSECIDHGKTFKEWKEYFRKNFSIIL